MEKRLFVDVKNCSCCGLCVDEYDKAFEILKGTPAKVYNQNALTDDEIEDVIGLCPAECIHYE